MATAMVYLAGGPGCSGAEAAAATFPAGAGGGVVVSSSRALAFALSSAGNIRKEVARNANDNVNMRSQGGRGVCHAVAAGLFVTSS